MINIILNNSESRILGLDKPTLWKLRTQVCYFNMGVYLRTKNSHAARTFLIDENGFFPTGLLTRVRDFLSSKHFLFQVIDNRVIPKFKDIGLQNLLEEPPMYEEQEIASSTLKNNVFGTVEMPTGIGKTRTIKETLLLHQRPSLIITPSSNLKQQTFEYLHASFGEKFVGLADRNTPKPITVMNYHSVPSKDPKFFDNFDVVIFDEYHNAANNTIREMAKTHLSNIYYKYGLTATNFKNDENAQILLECVLSNNLYSVTTLEAINRGYIVPIVPMFFDLKNKGLVSQRNYKADYKTFMDLNQERNGIAIEYAQKMIQQNTPTLILVEHVEHGRFLQASIKDSLFINGQDESAQYNMQMVKKFNNMEVPCLIGTSVIGEGVDTKACGAIFNLAGGKARSELQQRVGRAIRKFPNKKVGYYFDFIDNGQKHLLSHSKQRIEIIESTYGKKINIIS
jgi:superfamily II DNA or RNA helicase